MDVLFTVPEVAEHLKMSKSKCYELVKKERIPYIKIGRNIRIRESELLKWLDERTTPDLDRYPTS